MLTGHEEQVPAYRWVVIATLTSGVATALTSLFIIGLLLPDITEELGLSPSQQGWLGASAVFGNVILAIPIALWLSRYRPWRVVALSFLGIGVFTLLQGWSPTITILIAGTNCPGHQLHSESGPKGFAYTAVDSSQSTALHTRRCIWSYRHNDGRRPFDDAIAH